MEITLNGRREVIGKETLTVSQLLKERDVPDPDMVSVQLNGDILGRESFETSNVNAGDTLEFLYFMGGGGLV